MPITDSKEVSTLGALKASVTMASRSSARQVCLEKPAEHPRSESRKWKSRLLIDVGLIGRPILIHTAAVRINQNI